jgi:hypothetical protein
MTILSFHPNSLGFKTARVSLRLRFKKIAGEKLNNKYYLHFSWFSKKNLASLSALPKGSTSLSPPPCPALKPDRKAPAKKFAAFPQGGWVEIRQQYAALLV